MNFLYDWIDLVGRWKIPNPGDSASKRMLFFNFLTVNVNLMLPQKKIVQFIYF